MLQAHVQLANQTIQIIVELEAASTFANLERFHGAKQHQHVALCDLCCVSPDKLNSVVHGCMMLLLDYG